MITASTGRLPDPSGTRAQADHWRLRIQPLGLGFAFIPSAVHSGALPGPRTQKLVAALYGLHLAAAGFLDGNRRPLRD
jgi:hypothetical protein